MSTTTTTARSFHQGEALVIRPIDRDDPEALKHAGRTCYFHRDGVTPYFLVVRFEAGGKLYYFRKQDVIPQQREIPAEVQS